MWFPRPLNKNPNRLRCFAPYCSTTMAQSIVGVENESPRCLDNKALNRSDTCVTGQIAPWMIGCRRLYHPLHSQIHTLIVARLTRALSRLSTMALNPYESPRSSNGLSPVVLRDYRYLAYVLALFAGVIGWVHLRPLLTAPINSWGWQNWLFGFAPAAYLLFAAVVAVVFENYSTRFRRLLLPLVLAPLLAVTALIVFGTYVDISNVLAGKYSWSANLYTLFLALLCPVVWCYLTIAVIRAWRASRCNPSG